MVLDRLDVLTRDAVPAVRAGAHGRETPTGEGSPRWGLSANLRLDPDATRRIAAITSDLCEVVGPGHWPTGAERSSHVTLRPLEPHRTRVPDDDEALSRYADALVDACQDVGSFSLALGPVGMATTCVLLGARPLDGALERLYERFGTGLGRDGWFQEGVVRDLWYVSLLHFGRIVDDGRRLVDWVAERRELDLGTARCDRAQIIHWTLAEGRVTARPLVEVPLTGEASSHDGRATAAGHG